MGVDLSALSPAALSAAMRGGTREWGVYGSSAAHIRYVEAILGKRGRRKCYCGCAGRCTHIGCANGIALTRGCKASVDAWVTDPFTDLRKKAVEQLQQMSIDHLRLHTAAAFPEIIAPKNSLERMGVDIDHAMQSLRRDLLAAEWKRRNLVYFPTQRSTRRDNAP